jgi:hypothetical protein
VNAPDDFDWLHDDSVVLRQQDSVAVYENPAGDLVIRREAASYENEDVCVVINRHHVLPVVDAMLRVAGLATPQLMLPPPTQQATPGAIRQKRYRDRQRDEDRNAERNADRNAPDAAPPLFADG